MLRLALAGLLVAAVASPAGADTVDTLGVSLRKSDSYKVRLSAALSLARIADRRALNSLVYALEKDSEPTIRRAAALGILRQANLLAAGDTNRTAQRALRRASRQDRSGKVRQTARTALGRLGQAPRVAAKRGTNGLFVRVANPTGARSLPRGGANRLIAAVERIVRLNARGAVVADRSIELPTRAQLVENGMAGYVVDPRVGDVVVRRRGNRAVVNCSVSLRVARWDGRDGVERWTAGGTATAQGTGSVVTQSSRSGILRAQQQCVLSVVEQVTRRQVVPFLADQNGR